MYEINFKRRLGLFFVFSQFATLILIITLYFMGGFLYAEMTTSISLVLPLFSIYTLAIVKFFFKDKYRTRLKGKKITFHYSLLNWSIPILLCVYLMTIITLKAFNIGFSTFDEFKGMLAMTETVFGGYFGYMIPTIFDGKQEIEKRT